MRTHVITERPLVRDHARDIAALLSALKQGRAYVAGEYFRESKGFSFVLTDNSRSATLGDDFILESEACLTSNIACYCKDTYHQRRNRDQRGDRSRTDGQHQRARSIQG